MSRARLALLVLGTALVVALLSVAPGPQRSWVKRVVNAQADGPDPHYDVAIDAAAVRRAAKLLPDRTTYVVAVPAGQPVLRGNLRAAAQLFFAPALPVQSPADAHWALVAGAGGPRGAATYRLGGGLRLVRLQDR